LPREESIVGIFLRGGSAVYKDADGARRMTLGPLLAPRSPAPSLCSRLLALSFDISSRPAQPRPARRGAAVRGRFLAGPSALARACRAPGIDRYFPNFGFRSPRCDCTAIAAESCRAITYRPRKEASARSGA
jgi:hypothetical protein